MLMLNILNRGMIRNSLHDPYTCKATLSMNWVFMVYIKKNCPARHDLNRVDWATKSSWNWNNVTLTSSFQLKMTPGQECASSKLKAMLKVLGEWIHFAPMLEKKVKETSRECHNHKPQPFPDTKRKRKPTKPNKHKSNKRTKSTKISSLFPKRGNCNTKRTEKHKNKITQGKT